MHRGLEMCPTVPPELAATQCCLPTVEVHHNISEVSGGRDEDLTHPFAERDAFAPQLLGARCGQDNGNTKEGVG